MGDLTANALDRRNLIANSGPPSIVVLETFSSPFLCFLLYVLDGSEFAAGIAKIALIYHSFFPRLNGTREIMVWKHVWLTAAITLMQLGSFTSSPRKHDCLPVDRTVPSLPMWMEYLSPPDRASGVPQIITARWRKCEKVVCHCHTITFGGPEEPRFCR